MLKSIDELKKDLSLKNNEIARYLDKIDALEQEIARLQKLVPDEPSKIKFKKEKPEDVFDPDGASAIIIKDLVKQFDDVTAVNRLNLEIKKGELFGLLGPNGAGKTTTINMLVGLLNPTEGTAVVGGYDVKRDLNKIKEMIGVCPQEASVYKFLKGRENVELFGNLFEMDKKLLKERADKFFEASGLKEASNRKAKGYSGGMIRQLNLIIALINDPKIVFLDEPTVGMDPRARRKTWNFIGDLKQNDKTIILTTHYIEEAEALCDRVGIIDYGELIALGSPKELMKKHDATNLEEVFMKITGRRILEGV
ncbi:MAG: ATP-binding cassette domain-containing protein [Candidatus Lokiarchaeota archaeon]|nr:ATP-binding cassette domain-containing protein [Candidatus Lokiarchaeota archaeon]